MNKSPKCMVCYDTGIEFPENWLDFLIDQLNVLKNDQYGIACDCDIGNRIIPNVIAFLEPPNYRLHGDIDSSNAFYLFEKLIDERILELQKNIRGD